MSDNHHNLSFLNFILYFNELIFAIVLVINLFLFTVECCATLDTPDNNSELSTHVAVYGTEVIVTCKLGYKFINSTHSIGLKCLQGGVWNSTVPECECEL